MEPYEEVNKLIEDFKQEICRDCKEFKTPIKDEPCKSCTWTMSQRRPSNFKRK